MTDMKEEENIIDRLSRTNVVKEVKLGKHKVGVITPEKREKIKEKEPKIGTIKMILRDGKRRKCKYIGKDLFGKEMWELV